MGRLLSLLQPSLKRVFNWNPQAGLAFTQLEAEMSQTPVLALLNFNELFIIETDASGI